jgi:hypothetical protein
MAPSLSLPPPGHPLYIQSMARSLVQLPPSARPPVQLQPPPVASSPIQSAPLAPPQAFTATTTPASSGRKRKIKEEDNDVDKVPAKKKMARKQCIVCADDVARNQFPKFPHKQDAESKHSSDVCKKCCIEHISHEVKNKDHEEISCPQCSQLLEQSDIKNLASTHTYQECVNASHEETLEGEDADFRAGTSTKQPRSACKQWKSSTLARTPNVLGVSMADFSSPRPRPTY